MAKIKTQAEIDKAYDDRKELVCALEDKRVSRNEAVAQMCCWGYSQSRATVLVNTWLDEIANQDTIFTCRHRWWRRG